MVRIAALASLGAGAIHVAVTPDHFATYWLSGAFFLALSLFQIGWGAVLLLQPARALSTTPSARLWWLSAVVVSAGSIALWALTRSVVGEPFGPNAGTPLPIGPAGVISTILEAGLVVALFSAARVRPEKSLVAGIPLIVAATLVFGGASAYGVTAGLSHDHGGHTSGGDHLEDGHGDGEEADHDEDPAHHDEPSSGDPSAPQDPSATKRSQAPKKADRTPDASATTGDEDGAEPEAEHDDDNHGH